MRINNDNITATQTARIDELEGGEEIERNVGVK